MMQDGYGLHLWKDLPWKGGGRQRPNEIRNFADGGGVRIVCD